MSPRSNPKVSKPPWLELPTEITLKILLKLGAIDILKSAQYVCRSWRNVSRDVSIWRSIYIRDKWVWDLSHWSFLDRLCCEAVDRSQGELNDITIGYFGNDHLLSYIAQRCGQLKLIRLSDPSRITEEGLTRAVRYIPLLEELQLDYTGISDNTIKVIGSLCPGFKSFKLTNHRYRPVSDLEAQTIAKYMPELRHLQLIGSTLTNAGLKAILDGCPNLESLDLRQCFSVDLGGGLGQICSQRVKHLKAPNDPYTESDADLIDNGSSDCEDLNVSSWL